MRIGGEAPGGGPFSRSASSAMFEYGFPPPRIGNSGAVPQCQCALLLKPQKAPGELDHTAADPGVACFGEPLFPPLRAALVGRACQAGVARHRFAVTHWPREHLIDQDISRFDTNT